MSNEVIVFQGQITRIGNAGAHKMTRIWVEIPQEAALHFIKTLGWATEAAPIPVALYKVQLPSTEESSAELQPQNYSTTQTTDSVRDAARSGPSLVRRAALLCKDPLFWKLIEPTVGPQPNEEEAAEFVRQQCGVPSRSQILPGTAAAIEFERLERHFKLWVDSAKYEDANAYP